MRSGNGAGDPVPAFDAKNGTVMMAQLENVAGQGGFYHASEFDRYVAHDEIVHRRVEAFCLVKLVATANVKTGTQSWHCLGRRLASRNRVVREDDMHEVVEVDVGFEPVVAIPHIETVTAGRPREINPDVLFEHLCMC